MKKKNKLFTLIELIVVIVVIGILAAIVIPNISSFKEEASVTAMVADGRNLQTAVDLYQLEHHGDFPTLKDGVSTKPVLGLPHSVDFNALYPAYIRDLPQAKNLYYWIDYQGQFYYSTIDNPNDFVQGDSGLTWTANDKAAGYKIYRVTDRTTGHSNAHKIVLIKELTGKSNTYIPNEYTSRSKYLISVIDEYGFESAPVSEGYKGSRPSNPNNNEDLSGGTVDDDQDTTTPPSEDIGNYPPIQEEKQPSELDKLKLGDHVKFGEFNGHPILWNVVKKQDGKAMLFMKTPLMNPNGTFLGMRVDYAPNADEKTDSGRNTYGSSDWETSDIRNWLNGDFYNNAFTKKENIADTQHSYLLASIDSYKSTSGSEPHIYNYNVTNAMQNYSTAYKKEVSDKVYLVSIKELVENIKPVVSINYSSNSYWYWLRDPHTSSSYNVRSVSSAGYISNYSAQNTAGKVRAAITLDYGVITSGTGVESFPYVIE